MSVDTARLMLGLAVRARIAWIVGNHPVKFVIRGTFDRLIARQDGAIACIATENGYFGVRCTDIVEMEALEASYV